MKNKNIIKLFVFVFTLLVISLKAFAINSDVNILSKIYVERTDNNVYGINIFFDSKYKNSAFVQQRDTGSYYVFIPDTAMNPKNTKVIYKYGRDKSNIKINVEEKPFFKEDQKSSYVRLTVDVAQGYSIKILSNTLDNYGAISSKPFFNGMSIFVLLLLGCAGILIFKVIKMSNTVSSDNSYTSFPAGYINYEDNNSLTVPKDEKSAMSVPKYNMLKTIKASEAKNFSCFDMADSEGDKINNTFSFNGSKSLKNKTSKANHTNPISHSFVEDASEFSLPSVEDMMPQVKTETKPMPELLSVLNLAPNKGFYLTTIEDNAFGLFGFVNDNVFLLKRFKDLSQINLQARFYDRNLDKDVYIVRMDSYKAMVEVSETGMQELAVL